MKQITISLCLTLAFLFAPVSANADTQMQTLVLDAHDGERISGFLYQGEKTAKDAPIALLMHGLTGSNLHWIADGFPSYGGKLSAMLIDKGYRVVAIDARAHGVRKNDISPIERVMAARSGKPTAYRAMIENTIRDYDVLIKKLQRNFPDAKRIVAVGYSMGAQMAILLAAENDAVTQLITMVPPFVGNVPEVSPIQHAEGVEVPWLLLTANKDRFSTVEQNSMLAAKAAGPLQHKSYDSGHVLPAEYLAVIELWTSELDQ
ncbi:MAG: alpha/beta hydrolase [Kordiimonadales bacterium]|nr:MAG: alpha/beta hydrolase [Kordiimonadales bacterium]